MEITPDMFLGSEMQQDKELLEQEFLIWGSLTRITAPN